MSAVFPGGVKSFVTHNPGDTIQPSDVNDLQDEVHAIEDGYRNATAPLNSSGSTLASLSVLGGSTLASSITLGTQPYIFPAAGGTVNQVLGIASTSGSTQTLAWQTVLTPAQSLLRAASGSDSNASATTVDTIAITGLTAKDSLKIFTTLENTGTGAVNGVFLYHVTDGASWVNFANGNLSSNTVLIGDVLVMPRQVASTSLFHQTVSHLGDGTDKSASSLIGTATAWTGSFTLGLRHTGVNLGGNLKWTWSVFKVAGQ